jgi:peptidoglycan biosynthesis protein MviN/MurJ (putative lipid II flippase)
MISLNLSVKYKIEPLIVTLVNILARGSHLLFFIVIGNKYGASDITDKVVFFLAPLMVLTAVTSGAAETVIMPVFHRAENTDTAKYLFVYSVKKITKFALPLSSIIIVIFAMITGYWNFLLMIILLPVPLFGSLSTLKSGVLNASGRFRVAILGPLFGGLTAVSFLLLAPVNIYSFGLSFLLFELGKMGSLWFYRDISTGGHPSRSDLGDTIAKWGTGNARLQIISSLILALVYPVDVWFASTLEIGSITFVEYANKLWNIIPLLFVGHITITYSSLSKAESGHKKSTNPINVHNIALRYGAFGVGASVMVILMSKHIIGFLYGFGNMDTQQQVVLADLLNSYLLGAGLYVSASVYVKAMSAMGRVDLLLAVACLGLGCNIVCDTIFISIIGLNGIGFATSTVYLCNSLTLAYLYEKNRSKKHFAV